MDGAGRGGKEAMGKTGDRSRCGTKSMMDG